MTEPSTRRSTRDSAAATSTTAPCRSSIRACSETAKSTRSSFPPPSSTTWFARSRLDLEEEVDGDAERQHGRTSRADRDPASRAQAHAAHPRRHRDLAASRYIFRAMSQVLVLNASYEPLNVTSVRRAHVLVFKGKAEVIEELDKPLHSASDTYPWPHVIRLVQYVRVPRAVQRKISRRALFARDGWRCVYCGTTAAASRSTTWCREAGAGPPSGRTSSPRARRAT